MKDYQIDKLNLEREEQIEFAIECGLTYTGNNEEHDPVYIGDNKSWDNYNKGGKY